MPCIDHTHTSSLLAPVMAIIVICGWDKGLLEVQVTYSRLKDTVTDPIPSPNPEPPLLDAQHRVFFDHYVDDDWWSRESRGLD